MKLIFIYGPPATGKLTVAKLLAKKTGYKLFHNHLSVDLIKSMFDFGSEEYKRLSWKFRMELFESAAKNLDGLIFTVCYCPEDYDNKFVNEVVRRVKKHKGTVDFVQIYSDEKTLMKRVKTASRENFDKIINKRSLKAFMEKHDFYSKVPKYKSLSIDNTKVSATKVVEKIIKHYKLN